MHSHKQKNLLKTMLVYNPFPRPWQQKLLIVPFTIIKINKPRGESRGEPLDRCNEKNSIIFQNETLFRLK